MKWNTCLRNCKGDKIFVGGLEIWCYKLDYPSPIMIHNHVLDIVHNILEEDFMIELGNDESLAFYNEEYSDDEPEELTQDFIDEGDNR